MRDLPASWYWGAMQIHVTDEAVMITELSDEDMQQLLHLLRGTAGRSLVIPRKPSLHGPLGDTEQLAALISSLRGSAQETLAALQRRGFRIARDHGV
jgi:hypothetical protein